MTELSEETYNLEWSKFVANFDRFSDSEKISREDSQRFIQQLYEELKEASCALNEDTGCAYPGSLLVHINLSTEIAFRLAKMLSGTFTFNENDIAKVSIMMHLSKIEMFEKNTDEWQIKNRGANYVFAKTEGKLKAGLRSIIRANAYGFTFTPIQAEAMTCLDRDSEIGNTKANENILSTIIRTANELAYAIEKERNRKNQ